jgi:hypothetical protein
VHGTNPTKPDTDDDGLSDSAEIATHLTNPTLADTDADGLNDYAEIYTHSTNPLLADTDTDGLNDGDEISCGTSPSVGSTFPPFSDPDYCSGTASVELLTNGGFENGLSPDKAPLGWTIKKALGDKVKCDPLKAHSGSCAYKFRGGAAENTVLMQVIDLTGVTFQQGDHLALNAFFKGGNKAVRAKFILTIVYTGDALPTRKLATVGPSTAYKQASLPVAALISGEVQKITVMVKHKSLAGALWLDTVSLTLTPGAGDAASIRGVPAPSSAPETFRGSN